MVVSEAFKQVGCCRRDALMKKARTLENSYPMEILFDQILAAMRVEELRG